MKLVNPAFQLKLRVFPLSGIFNNGYYRAFGNSGLLCYLITRKPLKIEAGLLLADTASEYRLANTPTTSFTIAIEAMLGNSF